MTFQSVDGSLMIVSKSTSGRRNTDSNRRRHLCYPCVLGDGRRARGIEGFKESVRKKFRFGIMEKEKDSALSWEASAGSGVQVLASCDESGTVILNEEASFVFEEGPVEVSYINIDEENLLQELDDVDIIVPEDDGSRHSFDNAEENTEIELHVTDEGDLVEQIALTNNFFEGKLSFQEFLAIVESNESKEASGSELEEEASNASDESSTEESDLDEEPSSKDDPDYVPAGFKPKKLQPTKVTRPAKLSKPARAVSRNSDIDSDVTDNEPKEPRPSKSQRRSEGALPRGRRPGQKVIRRLPPALQGLLLKFYWATYFLDTVGVWQV